MSFSSVTNAGMDIALAVMGENFSLRGVTYVGVIDEIQVSEEFLEGVATPVEPIEVTFKKPGLSPAIAPGDRVTYNGKTYAVRRVGTDEFSHTLQCDRGEAR